MYNEIITLNNNKYQIWYESPEFRQNAIEEARLMSHQIKGHKLEHRKDKLLRSMGFQMESNSPPDSSKEIRKAFNML